MDFRSKKQDAENKVEKTKKLLGKTFYSLPENSWEVKQDLSKSSGVIYDYIYAQFCRTHKDRKIVNMYELIKTLKYTF